MGGAGHSPPVVRAEMEERTAVPHGSRPEGLSRGQRALADVKAAASA
jgi:hypothetical protein